MCWLTKALTDISLSEDHVDYLYGRAASEWDVSVCRTWEDSESLPTDVRAARVEGMLTIPLFGPQGQILGAEFRSTEEKRVKRFLLKEAEWNAVWAGMSQAQMDKLWKKGDVWITEGIFDVFPLRLVVPSTDVVLGTLKASMTAKHLSFLERFCLGWVHLVYDNDQAGQNGMDGWTDKSGKWHAGAYAKLKSLGIKVNKIPYTGKDPGDVWMAGGLPALRREFNGRGSEY